jgi:hypothetical protein
MGSGVALDDLCAEERTGATQGGRGLGNAGAREPLEAVDHLRNDLEPNLHADAPRVAGHRERVVPREIDLPDLEEERGKPGQIGVDR